MTVLTGHQAGVWYGVEVCCGVRAGVEAGESFALWVVDAAAWGEFAVGVFLRVCKVAGAIGVGGNPCNSITVVWVAGGWSIGRLQAVTRQK